MNLRLLRCGFVLAIALPLLAACGFHLRGSVGEGAAGVEARVALQTSQSEGELEQLLRSGLQQAGMTLVEQSEQAQVVLDLKPEQLDRRVQTVDRFGRASDYELVMRYTFRLATPAALADAQPREISTRREYRFDTRDVLGKAEEEQILMTEMRRDLAARLLRQVQYAASPRANAAGIP